jgi:mannose-1-phosphate guanylyltransferase
VRGMAETWVVVLAGREGSVPRELTANALGVPEQYCSVRPSTCLLQDAFKRAGTVALASHVCAVVSAQHRRWWAPVVTGLNEANVFVQPRDRGSGHGILLALLKIEKINPGAIIMLLPANHYFCDEAAITRALRKAGNLASANGRATYLLGTAPEGADPDRGYILPAERVLDRSEDIIGFTEKPDVAYARELLSLGALCNLSILVGRVGTLLELFDEDYGDTTRRMRDALGAKAPGNSDSLYEIYERILPMDFSTDVLEVQASRLRVIRVPSCGWRDFGAPRCEQAALGDISCRLVTLDPVGRRGVHATDTSFIR